MSRCPASVVGGHSGNTAAWTTTATPLWRQNTANGRHQRHERRQLFREYSSESTSMQRPAEGINPDCIANMLFTNYQRLILSSSPARRQLEMGRPAAGGHPTVASEHREWNAPVSARRRQLFREYSCESTSTQRPFNGYPSRRQRKQWLGNRATIYRSTCIAISQCSCIRALATASTMTGSTVAAALSDAREQRYSQFTASVSRAAATRASLPMTTNKGGEIDDISARCGAPPLLCPAMRSRQHPSRVHRRRLRQRQTRCTAIQTTVAKLFAPGRGRRAPVLHNAVASRVACVDSRRQRTAPRLTSARQIPPPRTRSARDRHPLSSGQHGAGRATGAPAV